MKLFSKNKTTSVPHAETSSKYTRPRSIMITKRDTAGRYYIEAVTVPREGFFTGLVDRVVLILWTFWEEYWSTGRKIGQNNLSTRHIKQHPKKLNESEKNTRG